MTITVSCPSCATSFPVDPAKIPPEGVRAQCSICPEIFDVDPPSVATPEAPPVEVAEPTSGDASETEDFAAIDMSIDVELPDTAEAAAEVAEPASDTAESAPDTAEPAADATPVSDSPPESPGAIRFGRRSAEDKARSLARSLVSDLIAYNPEKHKAALAAGNLQEVFSEEIDKSLKEYQEQVEPDVMAQGTFFNDALNSILAEEQSIFTLDH